MIPLTASQINTLQNLQASHQYADAYRYLNNIAQQNGTDPAVEIWLDRAASINADDGSFSSEFVRGATQSAGITNGNIISDADFQVASDKLANKVIDTVVGAGGIPDAATIIGEDVSAAVNDLGLKPYQWAGTIGDVLPPWLLGLGDDYNSLPTKSLPEFLRALDNALLAQGVGIARFLIESLLDVFGELLDFIIPPAYGSDINPLTNDLFNTAAKFVQLRRDPLTLDLDGDGLETVGTAAGILFDHDGDGIKNGSGWVSADDGFLVLDKNGNGSIDNGHELFGDAFVKGNGQLAADGFDALASLDGNGDGNVDTSDAQFGNLKVWQDLNQDGLSQAGELFTLAQLGIASINTASTDHNQTLANGNQIADLGTYTKTDGSLGTTGAVIGDINLATDTFHRQFPDHLDTSAVAHLPDMQACPERSRRGSGAVRDLREAANDCRWRMAA